MQFNIIQESSPRKYRSPSGSDFFAEEEVESNEDRVLYSLPPPGSKLETLMEASLDELVDAIEKRGWTVTLNRKSEE